MRTFVWGSLLALAGWAGSAEPDGKSADIDGRWEVTKFVQDGKEDEKVAKAKIVVVRKGGKQEITQDGKVRKMTYKIDAKKNPREIEFLDEEGKPLGLGIYEIKDDTMKLALLTDMEKRKTARPESFKEEKGVYIVYYKRVK